jgi:hypothetical protein
VVPADGWDRTELGMVFLVSLGVCA